MSSVTVLLGGAGPKSPFRAFRMDGGQIEDIGAPSGARDKTCILIIPGVDVQVQRFAIDARSQVQAISAAKYMFEKLLAEPDADIHCAPGGVQDDSGLRLVAAITPARLEAWIAACRAQGLEPAAVYADFTVWPAPDRTADAIDFDDLCMVSAGPAGGYAIEAAIAPALFQKWRTQAGADIRAVRRYPAVEQVWLNAASDVEVSAFPASGPLPMLLARAAASPPAYAPDLRQGRFAVREAGNSAWNFWRAAAAFVLLVFLVQTGVQAVAAYRDARAAKATLSLAERDLRAARPDVGRIVNLRAQVAALKADIVRSGAHPLLTVNDDLVETLKANSAVRLDQVRHEEPGRRVTLRVSADSPEILDAFGAALRQKGLPVQILARSPENGRHVAEIVLEAP
jgi:type II secretion system protein L